MKKKIIYLTACVTAVFLASCSTNDPDSPGFEFMPDMYRSPSYETNSGNGVFRDSMTNRGPVPGTITYEQQVSAYHPYPYNNDDSGYVWAGRNLKNPFPGTQKVLDEGKFLYDKYCTHCHGNSGDGDGLVGMKLPGPPPAYTTMKDAGVFRSEGKFYHSIHYGKGLMGAHAPLLTPDETWKVVRYVQKLQGVKFDATGMIEAPAPPTAKQDSVKQK